MGLYDRDYGRNDATPWSRVENPRSITLTLIVINVVVFFADMIFYTRETDALGASQKIYFITEWLAVYGETLKQPWMWWQFLSYGFVHDNINIQHLLFNMIGLFVFGREIERRMGRMEFLRFYLIAIIAGGIVGSVTSLLGGFSGGTIGASGAVVASAVLFACYFPNREILLFLVLPVKAWVLAILFVGSDLAGALGLMPGMGGENTAFTVHLAGAFFSLGYYFLHWNLRWLNLGAVSDFPARMRHRSRKMKLKLHDPDKKIEREAEDADRILAKIHEQGESSLTAAERKTLERYSRRQRERRN
ncbi:MAG: rhomboid family intramembrane serine protease [Rubripirellula sp.]|nr:rhomboid family intramembrane serine protease [Rubripirellula sp.]